MIYPTSLLANIYFYIQIKRIEHFCKYGPSISLENFQLCVRVRQRGTKKMPRKERNTRSAQHTEITVQLGERSGNTDANNDV